MINSNVHGILTLIRSAVTGEKLGLPDDFDFNIILSVAKKHQVPALIYYGALNCGVDNSIPAMQELFMKVCQSIAVSQNQAYEVEKIVDAFDKNKIQYMLLKGTILKKLYPKIEMRTMGDADILIKTEQYDVIKPIMIDLGYEDITESDHELIWRKPQILIELHKRLIPSYNKDYHAYYGDGWQLGKSNSEYPSRFEMDKEDQMIYLFTHFSKHYRDGGIGIRHFTDLYVYRNANKDLDENYIKEELKKLGLYDFYVNIIDTIGVWFEGKKSSDKTEFITQNILGSGVYGEYTEKKLAQTLRAAKNSSNTKNAKFKRFVQMMFPTLKSMKLHYSFLEKFPFLLPITWIFRYFDILFNKRKRAIQFYNDMKKISNDDVLDYENRLHYVGLDFNFKE